MRVFNRRPRYADIASTLALIIASTGTAYAANTVGTVDIIDGAVTTPKLAAAAVTNAKLGNGAVRGNNVADNSLTLSDIKGANAVGTISFSLGGNACGQLNINVSGVAAGQAALLTWTGTPPSHIVLGLPEVVDSSHIVVYACNMSATPFNGSNIGIRMVTFG